MKLTPIIAALRARCQIFENRVAGAAQFKNLPEAGKMKLPSAYVVPGDDSPGEQKSQTDYWQDLREGFSVIVFVSNGRDERGQWASYDVVHDIRNMLFKALLGWNPEPDGEPITYDGGTLLDVNRYELTYQFDFVVENELSSEDTRQQEELDSLDDLLMLAIDVDFINPGNGPDGVIEHHTDIHFPEN
ncbi:phage tail terminator protein [Kosakonia pseudosacchari]|uniref:phage tail terminator protein n=1 Tax=Kosakonia pseudosacchari TaxID=1646340 RepID=UPI003D98A595